MWTLPRALKTQPAPLGLRRRKATGTSEHTGEARVTAQGRQLVACTPAGPQRAGHRGVVQILVDFAAMLLVLVRLGLLPGGHNSRS